jgi:hypothetical protein
MKALKTPVLVPQREHRMVENTVQKVPKMPVDMKMLTYFQEAIESSTTATNKTNSRSNISSAESINEKLNSKRTQSEESFDTGGHHLKNDHVYKPFKHEKKPVSFFKEGQLRSRPMKVATQIYA